MVIDSDQYRELKKRFVKTVGHDEDVTVIFEEGRWDEALVILREIIDMQREDYEQSRKLADDLQRMMKGTVSG